MPFSFSSTYSKKSSFDLLILPVIKENKKSLFATDKLPQEIKKMVQPLLEDHKGEEGEWMVGYFSNQRIGLIGLGEKKTLSQEILRQVYSSPLRQAAKKKWKKVACFPPALPRLNAKEILSSICQSAQLTQYQFKKTKKEEKTPELAITFITSTPLDAKTIKRDAIIGEGVNLARDLVNGNASDITPQYFAALAKEWGKSYPALKVTVFDKKRIQKEGMGLLLAVNQGAACDPAFICMEYKGNSRLKDHTVLVGKGITFDTGGLNLKSTKYIETMRMDMGGAAAVFGTLFTLAKLKAKVNVTGVVAATENAIGPNSYKPGDVYQSYSGKTVEIGNTDAEGRLILADSIAYACKHLAPSRIIDLATLTGAIVVALGEEITGLMSNDDELAEQLFDAGQATGEQVWRLPLHKPYRKKLDSQIADINNCGGRDAGSITAGLFLQDFVEKSIPWAHLDIAGTAYLSKPQHYHSSCATGQGVRLLTQLILNIS